MKLIGLDIGDRWIGVAFGDSDLRIATPLGVIPRGAFDQNIRALRRFVDDYDAAALVVGLPRNMDGTLGPQAQATQAYAEQITHALDVRLVLWDERLTTVEATRKTEETGRAASARPARRGKKSRRTLDAVAAAIILQDYLDVQENETGSDDA